MKWLVFVVTLTACTFSGGEAEIGTDAGPAGIPSCSSLGCTTATFCRSHDLCTCTPTPGADPVTCTPDVPLPPPTAGASTCPTLTTGVVSCSSLAPECSGPVQPNDAQHEGGLHCLDEYVADPSFPCFCVGVETPDSWCIRTITKPARTR